MLKINGWKWKLAATAVYIGCLVLFSALHLPCVFVAVLGIPCPGCGMTRAVTAACRLDLATAFYHHSMFWSVPLLYWYFLRDGNAFSSKKVNTWVFTAIAVGFLAQWILKLMNFVEWC